MFLDDRPVDIGFARDLSAKVATFTRSRLQMWSRLRRFRLFWSGSCDEEPTIPKPFPSRVS